MELASQILGIVAIFVSALSMVFKSKKKILLFSLIYNLLVLTSYLLIGKYLGCILVGVLTIKNLVFLLFSKYNKKPNIITLVLFEVSVIALSIIFWQSWADAFVLSSSIITIYSTWQDNVKFLKICAIVCSIFLILYDIFVGAYFYIISETLYGGAALVSLIYKKRSK